MARVTLPLPQVSHSSCRSYIGVNIGKTSVAEQFEKILDQSALAAGLLRACPVLTRAELWVLHFMNAFAPRTLFCGTTSGN